jgi:DNA-binding NarL/FixJ family response regulator
MHPQIRLVMYTANDEPGMIRTVLDVGVTGYVLKRSTTDTLHEALVAVARGDMFVDPAIANAAGFCNRAGRLSEREQEVVRSAALGYSNKEIATTIGVSVKTVETYRYRAYQKLQLRQRSDLVRYAFANGLINVPNAASSGHEHRSAVAQHGGVLLTGRSDNAGEARTRGADALLGGVGA